MAALLTADTLVVSQRAKLVELTNQYDIWDPQGVALGFTDEQAQVPPAQDGPASPPASVSFSRTASRSATSPTVRCWRSCGRPSS